MRLIADESVDGDIVWALRDLGYAVDYVAELDPGTDDAEVLRRAEAAGALLVTADKDFGELVFRQRRASAGVVLVRLAGLSSSRKAAIVVGAVARHGSRMKGAFTVIASGAVRIRKPRPGRTRER